MHCSLEIGSVEDLQQYGKKLQAHLATLTHKLKTTEGVFNTLHGQQLTLLFKQASQAMAFAKAIGNTLPIAIYLNCGVLIKMPQMAPHQHLWVGPSLEEGQRVLQNMTVGQLNASAKFIETLGQHKTHQHLLLTHDTTTQKPSMMHAIEQLLMSQNHSPQSWAQALHQALVGLIHHQDFETLRVIEHHKAHCFRAIEDSLETKPELCLQIIIVLNEFCTIWRLNPTYIHAVEKLYQTRDQFDDENRLRIEFIYGRQLWTTHGAKATETIYRALLKAVQQHQLPIRFTIDVLLRMSTLARLTSNVDDAQAFAAQARELSKTYKHLDLEAESLLRMAMLSSEIMGDYIEGRRLFEEALRAARLSGNPQVIMGILIPLGEQEAPHEPAVALNYLQEAQTLAKSLLAPQFISLIQITKAKIHTCNQRIPQAISELACAQLWSKEHHRVVLVCMAHLAQAKLKLITNQPIKAIKAAQKTFQQAHQKSLVLYCVEALMVEITANVLLRRHKQAMTLWRAHQELLDNIETDHWQVTFIDIALSLSFALKTKGTTRQTHLKKVIKYLQQNPPDWRRFELYRCLWNQALAAFPDLLAEQIDTQPLVIASDGSWFYFMGKSVSLARRPTLKRIVHGLTTQHHQQDPIKLNVEQLFRLGWPNTRIDSKSISNRVYVAVAQLRKQGLSNILLSDATGYWFDPEVVIIISSYAMPKPTGNIEEKNSTTTRLPKE